MAGLLKQDPYRWTLWLSGKLKTWKYCASILADDALKVVIGVDMDNLHLMRRSYDFLCLLILYKTMPVCHRWTIAGGAHQNYYTQCILLEKEMTIKIFREQWQDYCLNKDIRKIMLLYFLLVLWWLEMFPSEALTRLFVWFRIPCIFIYNRTNWYKRICT